MRIQGLIFTSLLFAATGCKDEELPGLYYDVELVSAVDECNTPTVGYRESFEYRIVFDGGNVEVSVGDDLFATGATKDGQGCAIEYQSTVWQENREEGQLRWRILGEADIGFGTVCSVDGSKDWKGEETFIILSSEDETIRAGCEYTLASEGKFLREVK
jgi:hypothetical protein